MFKTTQMQMCVSRLMMPAVAMNEMKCRRAYANDTCILDDAVAVYYVSVLFAHAFICVRQSIIIKCLHLTHNIHRILQVL